MQKALLSSRGAQEGLWPGGPPLALPGVPMMQGVLAFKSSCLSLLICDPRGALMLAEEACEEEDVHVQILSIKQAESALLVRAYCSWLPLMDHVSARMHPAQTSVQVFVPR